MCVPPSQSHDTVPLANRCSRFACQTCVAPATPEICFSITAYIDQVDGLTATRELRRLGCMIPIIACTAAIDPPTCAAAGCNDWIAKPFTRDLIASTLNKWFAAVANGTVQYQQTGAAVSLSPSLTV